MSMPDCEWPARKICTGIRKWCGQKWVSQTVYHGGGEKTSVWVFRAFRDEVQKCTPPNVFLLSLFEITSGAFSDQRFSWDSTSVYISYPLEIAIVSRVDSVPVNVRYVDGSGLYSYKLVYQVGLCKFLD